MKLLRYTALLLIAGIALLGYTLYRSFYLSATDTEKTLYIRSDATWDDLRAELHPLISHTWALDLYAKRINLPARFKPGCYTILPGESVIAICRKIKLGEQTPINFTLSYARTTGQLISAVARQIEADSISVRRDFYDAHILKECGFGRDSLFSFIIPNTYQIYWTDTPRSILKRLRREYDSFWNAERTAKAAKAGLSPREAMTLASIVASETNNRDEMPLIAGVYMNRLKKRMPLQACPTVKYALQQPDLKRVLTRHLSVQSPFNTYINPGLPPSPICLTPTVAIDAVLDYTKSDYLYFCAREQMDGRHNFSRTLSEHMAHSRRYSAKLNSMKIK